MKRKDVDGGRYYELGDKGYKEVPAHEPDLVVCRRLADFPPGHTYMQEPELGPCRICGETVVSQKYGPHTDRPRVCMQCAGMHPLPITWDGREPHEH